MHGSLKFRGEGFPVEGERVGLATVGDGLIPGCARPLHSTQAAATRDNSITTGETTSAQRTCTPHEQHIHTHGNTQ